MTPQQQQLSSVISYSKLWLNGKRISAENTKDIVMLNTQFNEVLKYETERNNNQGCIYCIMGKSKSENDQEGKCYLKIGYSTFGDNILNRLKCHATSIFTGNFIPLFITPVHNEQIERQFHQTMKSKSTPLYKYKQNGERKKFNELYPANFSIVQSLNEYLENELSRNYESHLKPIF